MGGKCSALATWEVESVQCISYFGVSSQTNPATVALAVPGDEP